MYILYAALCVIFEGIYFYLAIVSIKPIDRPVKHLYLLAGNMLINMISGILFLNIYRYLLVIALNCCLMYFVCDSKVKAYDVFALSFFLLAKLLAEYIYFDVILSAMSTFATVLPFLALLSVCPFMFRDINKKAYNLIADVWSGKYKFYSRYGLLVMLNGLVLFIIYNIVKIKELI